MKSVVLPVGTKEMIIDRSDLHLFNCVHVYLLKGKDERHADHAICKLESRKGISAHRLILNVSHEMVVHHINGNGLDNRRCNLIEMSPSEHMRLHALDRHNEIFTESLIYNGRLFVPRACDAKLYNYSEQVVMGKICTN